MHKQSPIEEKWNMLSHALGAILGVLGLLLLVVYQSHASASYFFAILVYGLSVIILFSASALYHWVSEEAKKHRYRIIDHISIYLLIAGTYTPVLVITYPDRSGFQLLLVVWSVALVGIVLKLFFTGRFGTLSTLLYLLMGCLVLFDFDTLVRYMEPQGIQLLVAGGIAYIVGILFYSVHKIPYNHVIWHFFVLFGAIFHYFMVFFYVI